ncbi:hypothetical protein PTMSG1_02409 [Pyrenophora teres f. maculata]|nr:hypothetical protein PTMSG1_02409 [Pyrenophora teres f. maculata]
MGKQWYNHSSRSQQQPADANSFVNSTKTQAQVRDREVPLEGINVRGQAQNVHRGRLDHRNHRNVRDDRRSRSPERNNSHGESRGQHRNNSRPHAPLPPTKLKSDSKTHHQQLRKGEASALVSQSTKRKRDNDHINADEELPRSYKKPHTGSGHMTPTVSQKVVTGMAAITKLSDEERKKLRAAKFASKPAAPTKAPVKPKEIPKITNRRAADVVTQEERRAGPIPTNNAGVTNSQTQHNHVATASQNDAHTKIPDTNSYEHPPTKIDAPKQTTIKVTSMTPENKTVAPKTFTPPTPLPVSSNTTNASSEKRKNEDVVGIENSSCKKVKPKSQSSSNVAHSSVIQANIEKRNAKLKELMSSAQAGEEENPHKAVDYVEYSIYSIPISYSTLIEHEYEFEPIDSPPEELKRKMTASEIELFGRKMLLIRQAALRVASDNKRKLSEILGRKTVPMSGPIKVIEDCDLYWHDNKIHVATEHGLLTVPNYLELLNVPETQPVRFEGRKPSWMRQVIERRVRRRAKMRFDPGEILLDQGCIELGIEDPLIVLDRGIFDINIASGEESFMAYGLCTLDGVEGWFPYEATCRMDWGQDPNEETKPDPNIINWCTFDYGPAARAATLRQQGKAIEEIAAAEAAFVASNNPAQAATVPFITPGIKYLVPSSTQLEKDAHQVEEVPSLTTDSEGSTSGPVSPQSQAETISMISRADGTLSRYDSPQAVSQQTVSGGSGGDVDDDSLNSATAAYDDGGKSNVPGTVPETPSNAFTKPRASLPGFPGSTKPMWKEEDDIDYDDDEL